MANLHRTRLQRSAALLAVLFALLSLNTASADLRKQRPFTDNSPWNTPIGANPAIDRYSSKMLDTLRNTITDGQITSDPNQYSYPVYYVDKRTPRWDIPCVNYKCTIYTPDGVTRTTMLKDVPLPVDALPSTGSDGQIIVIDTDSGTEYDLWQVKRTSSGWTASNASIYNIGWDGAPENYGSRGAGVPYYAGLVRPWEIDQGRIEHALAFAYPTPAEDRCVYPASKTDGRSDLPYAIPEGARIQLDPSLTEADFKRWGLSRTGIIIAKAMQEYGMYLIDISGRPKIIIENLKDNPHSTRQWSDPDLNLTEETIAAIPHTAFRVLELPAAYWDRSVPHAKHGTCISAPPEEGNQ